MVIEVVFNCNDNKIIKTSLDLLLDFAKLFENLQEKFKDNTIIELNIPFSSKNIELMIFLIKGRIKGDNPSYNKEDIPL